MYILTGIRSHARDTASDTDAAPLSMDQIRDLALRRPGTPVLSLHVRTDPRDPANAAAVPGWLIELRNSLRMVGREADERESREQRMAARELRERVERDVLALEPAGRGRGLAWFRTADGSVDHRFTLRLPPLRTLRDAALQPARALAGETIGALTRAVRRRSAGRRWPATWCSTGSAT
jgi:hypothetical protein